MNNKKVKNCSSKSKISNGNKNNKYDLFQLQSLLEELKNKDEEYNLIIKGLKDRIFETKKESHGNRTGKEYLCGLRHAKKCCGSKSCR